MKYYKQLIDKKVFEATYNIKLEDFNLYNCNKSIKLIPTCCDNCKQLFWISTYNFKRRLCFTENYQKCHGDTWYCNKQECVSLKKHFVVIKGMIQSEAKIKSDKIKSEYRKGKSLEELYGVEKATLIKNKIKNKRAIQKEPMKGKHHSDKSKLSMSLSKREIYSKNEKLWKHPITEEPCTFRELISYNSKKYYKHYNKEEFTKKVLEGQINYWKNKEDSYEFRWFDNKKIICQSSYEQAYVKILNNKNIYFDRCNFIIPYIWEKRVRHYNPDFVIYENYLCSKIKYIIEVKPKKFLDSDFIYTYKNREKLKALKSFCDYNNYIMTIITEEELNENKAY